MPPLDHNLSTQLESQDERKDSDGFTSSMRARLLGGFRASAFEIWLGFALAVATLLTVGLVSYESTREFTATTDWVTHTYRVIEVLRDLQAAATSVENQSWAYILGNDPAYLTKRKRGLDRLEANLAELKPLISDNPGQVKNLDALAPILRQRVALGTAAMAEARRHGPTAGVDYVLANGWTELGDEIDRRVGAMAAVEEGLLDQRQLRERSVAGFAIRMIVYGSLAALLFVCFAAVFIQRVLGRLWVATAMAETQAHHAEQRGRELTVQINEVRISEQRFRDLFEAAPDAMFLMNRQFEVMLVNSRAEQILGYSKRDLLGGSIRRILAPILQAGPLPEGVGTFSALPGYHGGVIELTARRGDGIELPIEMSLSAIESTSDVRIAAIIHDVSERRRAEVDRALLSAIVEFSNYAISSLTPDLKVLTWNAGSEKVYGYRAAEMTGGRIDLLSTPGLDDSTFTRSLLLRGGAGLQEFETQARRKDGAVIDVAVSMAPILDRHGKLSAISAISRDITERKRAEAALLSRTAELARSNAELEQFAYVASHDLQEPLRMVASYLQLIAQRYSGRLDADADDFINFAVDGATRMKQLINDLLNYSRAGRGPEPVVLDLSAPLSRALASLSLSIEETSAEITNDPLPRVIGDENRLYEVFQNLIGNAIKFRGSAPAQIHIGARREGGEWTISVADHGIGIAPEYQQRIFAMFQRLHGREEYPGTGIGLAICKRIVERLGGRIWVDSQAGQGATFCFTLSACEVENDSDHDCEARVGGDSAG